MKVDWKSKDKDLTGGLLSLACEAYSEEKKASKPQNGAKDNNLTPSQQKLKKKIATTAMGGGSFFAWFGYIGHRVSAEESAAYAEEVKKEQESGKKAEQEEDDEEEEDDLSYELEIFADGDDLAVAISEDLWPGALKYFSKSTPRRDKIEVINFPAFSYEDAIKNGAVCISVQYNYR